MNGAVVPVLKIKWSQAVDKLGESKWTKRGFFAPAQKLMVLAIVPLWQ
jgi:hypothetical protein